MSDAIPSKSNSWAIVLAVIGCFAIFGLILAIAYLPKQPAPLTQGTKSPEERKALLVEQRAKEASAAQNYGWIDQPKGVVRLPIDRAMELTIQDLNAKK